MPGIEDTDGGVGKFADFMTFLAPPPAHAFTLVALAGGIEFAALGCATCHVATLTTGPNATVALDRVTFHPYSDFLLHDMGSLGDGIAQGSAGPRVMRTAPLWGVSSQPIYLHDGRAHTLEEAILAHDGEASAARKRYAKLNPLERQALLAFLNSL